MDKDSTWAHGGRALLTSTLVLRLAVHELHCLQYVFRAPTDHIDIRILHSASTDLDREDSRNHGLMFMWSFRTLVFLSDIMIQWEPYEPLPKLLVRGLYIGILIIQGPK